MAKVTLKHLNIFGVRWNHWCEIWCSSRAWKCNPYNTFGWIRCWSWCCFLVLVQDRTWTQVTLWWVIPANHIQSVIDMADIHTNYPGIERYQLKLSHLSYLCKYPLINKLVFSQVYRGQVGVLYGCSPQEWWAEQRATATMTFFFSFGVTRMQWCIQVKALFNNLGPTPPFSSQPPFPSLSVFFPNLLFKCRTPVCTCMMFQLASDPHWRHTAGTHLILLHWNTSGTAEEKLTQISQADW